MRNGFHRPLWLIAAVVAFIYGLGFVFFPDAMAAPALFWGGAIVCLVLFLAAVVTTVLWMMRRPAGSRAV